MERVQIKDMTRWDFSWLGFGYSTSFPCWSIGYGVAKYSIHLWINIYKKCPWLLRKILLPINKMVFVKEWHSSKRKSLRRFIWTGSINEPWHGWYFRFWRFYFGGQTPKPIYNLIKKWNDWKMDRKNKRDLHGIRCTHCGSHKIRQSSGFAGEPMLWCAKCKDIFWSSDPTPYIE